MYESSGCRGPPSVPELSPGEFESGQKQEAAACSIRASRHPSPGVKKPRPPFPGLSSPRPPIPTTPASQTPASSRSPAPRLASLSPVAGGPGGSLGGMVPGHPERRGPLPPSPNRSPARSGLGSPGGERQEIGPPRACRPLKSATAQSPDRGPSGGNREEATSCKPPWTGTPVWPQPQY